MRIDLFNSTAAQLGNDSTSKKVASQSEATTDVSSTDDRTTLSSSSSSVSSLVSEAMSSPEVRQEKIASLQQAVSNGSYKLEPNAIAGAMIDEHA